MSRLRLPIESLVVPMMLLLSTGACIGDCGSSDADVASDAGTTEADAGTEESDAGTEESDAGTEESDAGTEESDAGTEESDAGNEESDAGTEESDAGTPDAGAPPDTDAPTPGAGMSSSGLSGSIVTLSWGAGSDSGNDPSGLAYLVVQSTQNNIGTVVDAETNGTIVMPWTIGVTSFKIDSGLAFNTTYYFAVLVKDSAGNKSAYAPISVTTEASGQTGLKCPSGEAAVGIYGRVGAWFDQLGVVCATLSGTTLGTPQNGPAIGGTGGNEFNFTCAEGEVLAEIQGGNGTDNAAGWCTTDTTIFHQYRCRNLVSGTLTDLSQKYGEGQPSNCAALASGAFSYTCGAGKEINGIIVEANSSGNFVGFTRDVTCL